MAAVLIFNHVYWFWKKTTFGKLVAMATKERISLIYELENFASTYFFDLVLANFSSSHCANIFLIPQISHNRGGPCRQFFEMHLLGRQCISAMFLMQTFLLNHDNPPAPWRKIIVRPLEYKFLVVSWFFISFSRIKVDYGDTSL